MNISHGASRHRTAGTTGILELVVQHAGTSLHYSTICSLLCVSKGVQNAVTSVPGLQLAVQLTYGWGKTKACSFAAFIRKFGTVLRDVHISMGAYRHLKPVAAALMYAALQPRGLNIRSLTITIPDAQLMCLLPLFSKTLTRLEVDLTQTTDDVVGEREEAAELVLSALTNLRVLGIYHLHWLGHLDQLLHPVSGLTTLTSLTLAGRLTPEAFRPLSAQLRELYLSYDSDHYYYADRADEPRFGLQLAQLTALTKLGSASTVGRPRCEEGHALRRHDTFPSCLRQATFRTIESVQPLLQLTNLQELTVLSASTAASELLQLGTVSSLTAISICWGMSVDLPAAQPETAPPVAAANHALSALPLTCLQLDCDLKHLPLGAIKVLSELSSCTALTALTIDGCDVGATTAREFAVALSQLTGLQHLTLASPSYEGQQNQQMHHYGGYGGDADAYGYGAHDYRDRSRSPSDGRPWSPAPDSDNSMEGPADRNHSPSRNHSPWSDSNNTDSPFFRKLSAWFEDGSRSGHVNAQPHKDVMLLVCEAVTNLRQLRSLSMLHQPLNDAAARQLQGLSAQTQLTLVQLDACQLTDEAIASLLGSLPGGLRHVDLGRKTRVGERSLAVLGQGLQHLTELGMGCWLPWYS